MHWIDWLIVGIYCLASLLIGALLTRKASQSVESYFAGNRKIPWWLAGTSIAATAFSSDTPLLVTGITRSRGLWGNWEIWALAISTMLAVFFFSRLWKRTGVLTEVEFVEFRYAGKSASFLRGFKAVYWGFFYNAFVIGAWPITGLVKVMQETTGWSKTLSILFCLGLATSYTSLSGYRGVIATDFFQFLWAMVGAVILAIFALNAVGGTGALVEKLSATAPEKLSFLPPPHMTTWFLGLLFIQWWAWKNADGGGIAVQRMVSCKDEKESMLSMLWFNIVHYALRFWPWIITALASLILIPDISLTVTEGGKTFVDHERAYPRLIEILLPVGFKGVLVASFFAAFMSTVDSQLNWGASYLINDFYRRFLRKNASESHYIFISRIIPFILAVCAAGIAFYIQSIGQVFTFVLNLTAGVGPVLLLRWFWWRVNAWSEITAMTASFPLILFRSQFFQALKIPPDPALQLLYMIAGTSIFWIPVTLLTQPAPEDVLQRFLKRVSPPGLWPRKEQREDRAFWILSLKLWPVGVGALFATISGPLLTLFWNPVLGLFVSFISLLIWITLFIKKNGDYQRVGAK